MSREVDELMARARFQVTKELGVFTRATMAGYICPHCDNTHFEIMLKDIGLVTFRLTAKEAEFIGNMLLNPKPVDPAELDWLKD